ncbi:hypothetical protein PP175_28030 (plasmid) [Aneurinibacillus sp. Ricciae_BoGa-3]|uniref:hypothetical protein n=1 Tax=Aneurinibacillus sp. Ricciae_BoGa-3 TaxID=3022697 RepID=UPI0023408D98|nr:hypothetical protein [Aneurinibacillus sp. Ricciae_BoGa-3]WCK57041.1 hypothetical protein PP175_28030 [Aneurinibacillus sp. Ricciae_BoGa-3]
MSREEKNFKKYIGNREEKNYLTALRTFTQMTIDNPSFFSKTPEEQQQIAYSVLKANKEGLITDVKRTK